MKTLIFDVESDHLVEKTTKIHCLVITDMDTGITTRYNQQPNGNPVELGIKELEKAYKIIGHNIIGFDILVIKKLYSWFTPPKMIEDTLVMTRLIWPDLKENDFSRLNDGFPKEMIGSHSLKAWGIRIGLHKGDFKESNDFEVWTPAMEDYCVQDVAVTLQLYRLIQSKNPSKTSVQLEHDFAQIMQNQEAYGFKFDNTKAEGLCALLQKKRAEIEANMQAVFPPAEEEMKSNLWATQDGKEWVTKKQAVEAGYKAKDIVKGAKKKKIIPFNAGSRDQIANRFIAKGWKPQEFTPDGKPKVDEQVLTALEKLGFAEAKPLLEYLLVSKRLGQLAEGKEAWMKLVKQDGRMHGRVITNGAVTGRCTHRNPNMAQVPRVGSAYGAECRSLFVATNGFKLIGADASGIELRCLAHFMAPYDGGSYAKVLLEGDIHTANQQASGLPTRNDAKTFIYAFLYGAGPAKIGSIINKGEREGRKIIDQFQTKLPAIKRLKDAVELAVNQRGYLIGLDGRHLPVRSAHASLNVLLQSAGALIMKRATINLVRSLTTMLGYEFGKDYGIVAHIHDELQIEAKCGIEEAVGRMAVTSIRQAGLDFKFRCPLDGEFKTGFNWAETH